ncbi:glycosyltransferase family 8 protein [Lysinibacillus sp. NPDC047702]|uniref:glycosyltransferase family 8 protein n=1 Tax=unclassified Lysinibacillus TaxID=2636778 RepID=UPI003D02B78C
MQIACSINKEYIPHMCAMLLSAYQNTSVGKLNVHVLHADLDEKDQCKIIDEFTKYERLSLHFYEIDQSILNGIPIVAEHLSVETLYRLLMPIVLPNKVEKILYIDSDIIIKNDLLKVWNEKIEEHYIAAVVNLEERMYKILELNSPMDYFNAGFMLINLKKWRENDFLNVCLNYVRKNIDKIIFADQDILNGVLKGNWKRLHPMWNVISGVVWNKKMFEEYFDLATYENIINNPSVIHYTGLIKPWHINSEHYFKKEYYIYANQLSWRKDLPIGMKELKHSDLYLFGTGVYSLKVTNILNNLGIRLLGYLDNDKAKWNGLFENKPIFKPDNILLKHYERKVIIIIASSFESEILQKIHREYKLDSYMNVIRFSDLHTIK